MSFVTYEPQGAVAYLIINRPEALNALNSQVLADLDAALDAVDLDTVRCLIVRGAGEKSFVAGADIAQMKELSPEEAETFSRNGNLVMRRLETFPIPTIAAVGGYALGGMKVRPLGERVLVKMDKVEEKTAGGIFIPQTAQEKTQIAVVEAVGDDVKTVKVGEKVLHDKYSGTNVKIDGEEYLILDIKDVLAVIA